MGKDDVREWNMGKEKHWLGSHFALVEEAWLLGGRWHGSQASRMHMSWRKCLPLEEGCKGKLRVGQGCVSKN